ncbi:hypothetical protein [Lusitaniella coriacea]|uniref:hypothetical protein n=1 Tax=Lusitaniella coriacea TaxID=1983105 RepID=UPI003CEF7803
MAKNQHKKPQTQKASAGRDAQVVGGDYTNTRTTTINLWIPLLVISILALGGLSWAFVVGKNQGEQNPQGEQQLPPSSIPKTTP